MAVNDFLQFFIFIGEGIPERPADLPPNVKLWATQQIRQSRAGAILCGNDNLVQPSYIETNR